MAFASAAQVSTVRGQEADGFLDNLLARPVTRARWLAGRLGFAAAVVVGASPAAGVGG